MRRWRCRSVAAPGGDFGAEDSVDLGAVLGVPERAVRRVLSDVAERVDRWLPQLDQLPFDRGKVGKLRRVIQHHRDRVAR